MIWKIESVRLISDYSWKSKEKISLCLVPRKYYKQRKNVKEHDFLIFGCLIKNLKENQI